ncbi:Diacylglycerol kinase family enzyme [Paracidovorax anthurii]|uniref:Diacylglycerol kinase family enzyme n=2 Tax=Paracidovorax anthurii TaxID=78229 RepID=A0A328ZFY8_9BURK|nr:diacylglycerol kinase family enzyme [Paracidovorax anthurii]
MPPAGAPATVILPALRVPRALPPSVRIRPCFMPTPLPPSSPAPGPVHLVVPHRPGADHSRLRARLEALESLRRNAVRWHVPAVRAGIVQAADEAARAALDSGGIVVACGGDGTINAVAAAAWRHRVRMGVIPAGTFNYFAREHSLPLDLEQAAQGIFEALHTGDLRPVRVGYVNDRMFLVNAAVGLYPRLLEQRELASRRFGRSRWVAIASAVWSFLRPASARRWRVSMRAHRGADALVQEEFFASTLFVGNNPLQLDRLGIPQARDVAECDHLAVLLLKPQSRWATACTVWHAAIGQLARDEAVISLACSEMEVEPASWRPQQVKVAFDGEREWMPPPLRFRVEDRPLWLVVPTATARDGDAAAWPEGARADAAPQPQPQTVPADPAPVPGAVPGTAPGLAAGS